MSASTDPGTLTRATVRAAEHLGLSALLSAILGVTEDRVANMTSGVAALDPSSPEWPAAQRLMRLFRLLVTVTGDPQCARAWLDTPHQTLRAIPKELLTTAAGSELVVNYLDGVLKYEIKLPPRAGRT